MPSASPSTSSDGSSRASIPSWWRLAVRAVGVHAEREVVAHVPDDVEGFQHHLRAVLGTLQQARWRRHILPDDSTTQPRALVFTFLAGAGFEYRFVLDRVAAAPAGRRFFLRITVEDPRGRRLDLSTIPHVVVDDLDDREYIAGSTRIAQTLRDMMQREAERGRRTHLERRKRGSFVFGQLERAGLGALELVHLAWSEALAGWLAAGRASPPRRGAEARAPRAGGQAGPPRARRRRGHRAGGRRRRGVHRREPAGPRAEPGVRSATPPRDRRCVPRADACAGEQTPRATPRRGRSRTCP